VMVSSRAHELAGRLHRVAAAPESAGCLSVFLGEGGFGTPRARAGHDSTRVAADAA
jgi:hypothetical protein